LSGFSPPTVPGRVAEESGPAYLARALDVAAAQRVRHPACHRFIEPRSVSHGCEVTR
jgi:hypothetical protein